MDLNLIWFVLVGVLIAGYAVLDGFDLGIGALSLFAKSEAERDVHVAAVAPVWDGNEVWLLTGGGALFAAFPVVYATVFSGFYLALVLVLVSLIARAVSMEFRAAMPEYKRAWDVAFGVGSLLPAILFGVAVGNVLHGVPVDTGAVWKGTFLGLLNPYSILVGLVSLAMFVMHGALYLRMKSEGALEARMAKVAVGGWAAFVVLFLVATGWSYVGSPFLFGRLTSPLTIVLLLALAAGLAGVPLATRAGRAGLAFLSSSVVIVTGLLTVAANAFPVLVPSSLGLEKSLTVYNASSSPRTLMTMLVIALIGVPIVIGYTIFAYRVFKGKARAADAYAADVKAAA